MNRFSSLIASLVLVNLLVESSPVHAILVNDGSSHIVDTEVNDFIGIFNGPGNTPTTVTFNAGANITGTDFDDDTVYVLDSSMVIINGGIFADDVTAYDQASIIVHGGQLQDDLFAIGSATISVLGGVIADDVTALGNSTVFLNGGSFGEDIEAEHATIDISGGILAANGLGGLDVGFGVDSNGLIILRGTSFLLNGAPTGAGLVSDVTGTLSGVLADGSSFNNIPFDRDPSGGFSTGRILLVAVPEASQVLAFGVVGLALAIRGRFSRRRKT